MKLTARHSCCSCILLIFCCIACSQSILSEGGSSLLCEELRFSKLASVSDIINVPAVTAGLLHLDSENLSLQLSWSLSRPGFFHASIVRVASGLALWNSESLDWSTVLVLCLNPNGGFVVKSRPGDRVLWASIAHGMRVRDFKLVEDKVLLLQAGKAPRKDLQQKLVTRKINRLLQSSSPPAETAADEDDDDRGGHRNKKVLAMEIIFPVVGFLLLLALCRAIALSRRRGKSRFSFKKRVVHSSTSKMSMTRQEEDEEIIGSLVPVGLPPRLTYAEMDKATNGFTKKLGEGGYGAVYEGALQEPRPRIAVKVFQDTASLACRNGFCKEVLSIGKKKHPNLVPLRGFCVEDEHRMLVYELMENGSLNKLLFGSIASGEICSLQWSRRAAIAMDTARALAFLHEEGEQKRAVIHCDLKPENILLDENWVAKVSDFGLAKFLWGGLQKHHDEEEEDDEGGDHDGLSDGRHPPSINNVSDSSPGSLSNLISSKGIRGTLGYLAPEWISVDAGPGSITPASDVYSFGVVLLELLAGRRAMVPGLPFLLGQAFDMLLNGDDVAGLLDDQLLEEGSSLSMSPDQLEEARNMVKIGLWCLQEDPTQRPTMAAILKMLTDKEPVPTPPFCDYFAGSSHFFDEVDYPIRDSLFSNNKEFVTSTPTSDNQGSWQMSILSGR